MCNYCLIILTTIKQLFKYFTNYFSVLDKNAYPDLNKYIHIYGEKFRQMVDKSSDFFGSAKIVK